MLFKKPLENLQEFKNFEAIISTISEIKLLKRSLLQIYVRKN